MLLDYIKKRIIYFNRKKIYIVQFYTSNIKYAKFSKEINKKYANKYNYGYYCEEDSDKILNYIGNKNPTWYKMKLVLDVFKAYNPDYVLFLDMDAIVIDFNQKIENFIDNNFDLIVSEDIGSHSLMNAGVFLIKNTSWSIFFLDKWYKCSYSLSPNECTYKPNIELSQLHKKGYYSNSLWHDQTSLTHLYYDLKHYKNKIKIISNRVFNWHIYNDSSFIFHAFSYGTEEYRYLDKAYNDIIINKNKKEKLKNNINSKKLFIVYHCFLIGDWESTIKGHLNRIKKSGLYDRCENIYLTVNLNNIAIEHFNKIVSKYRKLDVEFYNDNIYEYPGISKVKYLGDNFDCNILYVHTKGVSNFYERVGNNKISKTKVKNIQSWKECLEYFLIDKWKDSLNNLDNNDCVGVTNNNGWYWGNFWWASSDYIKKCSNVEKKHDRWYYESWLNDSYIGEKKFFEYYHFDFNPYTTFIKQSWYKKPNRYKGSKIVLKSAHYGTPSFDIDEGHSGYDLNFVKDVTKEVDIILKRTNNLFFDFQVTNENLGGDPIYGVVKFLFLEFHPEKNCKDIYKVSIKEGNNFEFRF